MTVFLPDLSERRMDLSLSEAIQERRELEALLTSNDWPHWAQMKIEHRLGEVERRIVDLVCKEPEKCQVK